MKRRRAPRTLGAIARWTAIIVFAPIILFALSGWIGSMWSRNNDWADPDPLAEPTIAVMVGHNGIHTEIAMPLVSIEKDWRTTFPASDIEAALRPYTHVSVSWGERKFFLETPTWADVDPVTVLQAMVGGEGVLHVAHYVRPAPSDDYRVMHLRPHEYRALVAVIERQLDPPGVREVLPGYGAHDVFYTASGTYHIGNTCNQWTSDRLAAAGVRIGMWTPFPGGVMKWVPQLEGR
ncbi:MAG: DUF2459 domain-containing protein [Erythrobacter sp.]